MTSGKLLTSLVPLLAILALACSPPSAKKSDAKTNPSSAANSPSTGERGEEERPGASVEEDGTVKRIETGSPNLSDAVDPPAGAETPGGGEDAPARPPPGVLTPRCAVRLSIALNGKSPDATTLATKDVPAAVDRLLASADFAERYARFINAEFNAGPAPSGAEDPVYYLAKHVITNDKPWSNLFVGAYNVTAQGANGMRVANDNRGLGYFRTQAWMKRYAGNESEGLMLVGAFRILSNTTNLELTPSVGQPEDNRSEAGRKAEPCNSCHFEKWYALDKVARLLPRKRGTDMDISFTTAPEKQTLLGKELADDKALVNALVASDSWRFAQCRNVFKFLYGRAENKCEAAAFDRCVDALVQQKTIRAAVAAVAKDGAVCQ